ncbi:MAG: hypothetical protein GY821_06715 [Gammaproteobacteria bacterium]|nr:hypothetical protein [Gammaproteobacteria bacterium]
MKESANTMFIQPPTFISEVNSYQIPNSIHQQQPIYRLPTIQNSYMNINNAQINLPPKIVIPQSATMSYNMMMQQNKNRSNRSRIDNNSNLTRISRHSHTQFGRTNHLINQQKIDQQQTESMQQYNTITPTSMR